MPTRISHATWSGDLKSGGGRMIAGSGLFDVPNSRGMRFGDDPGSNPEELVAAAHAGCYSMFLSSLLSKEGVTINSINTSSAVTLETVDGAPTISKIHLKTEADVVGIDAAAFAEAAQQAKEACPVSKALACVKSITLEASLVS